MVKIAATSPMPIAYFITWANYGTWLPGDQRGWILRGRGVKPPDPVREMEAQAILTADACILDEKQRRCVEKTISKHCKIRKWTLHAVNCRTSHVHVVVSAKAEPNIVREQFKAWATRNLKELDRSRLEKGEVTEIRDNWWAERGWNDFIDDDESLTAAIEYVRDCQ